MVQGQCVAAEDVEGMRQWTSAHAQLPIRHDLNPNSPRAEVAASGGAPSSAAAGPGSGAGLLWALAAASAAAAALTLSW